MAVLWFGKAKKLEDLNEKDLKKERGIVRPPLCN
jgi:hypothetical protein